MVKLMGFDLGFGGLGEILYSLGSPERVFVPFLVVLDRFGEFWALLKNWV